MIESIHITAHTVSAFIILVFNLGMFSFALRYVDRKKELRYFLWILASIVGWQFVEFLARFLYFSEPIQIQIFKLGTLFSSQLGIALLFFFTSFQKKSIPRWFNLGLFVLPVSVIILTLSTNKLHSDIIYHEWGLSFERGPWYWIQILNLVFNSLTALFFLAWEFIHEKNSQKKSQLKILILGFSFSLVLGIVTDAILPALEIELLPLGNVATVVFSATILVAIFRFNFLNVNLNNLLIRQKILFGFSIITLLFFTSSFFGLTNLLKRIDSFQIPIAQEIDSSVSLIKNSYQLDKSALLIQYYDEVLTQSVRNYAFTQRPEWKQRYIKTEPILDETIKEVIKQGPEEVKTYFAQIDEANIELVEIERNAFNLVDEGQEKKAQELLDSEIYLSLKREYTKGLDDYASFAVSFTNTIDNQVFKTLEEASKSYPETLRSLRSNVRWSIGFALVLVLAAFVVSRYIAAQITLPLEKLQDLVKITARHGKLDLKNTIQSQDEIGELSRNFDLLRKKLRGLVENLEFKVKEKTLEVQKQLDQEEKTTEAMLYILERSKRANEELTQRQSELDEVNKTLEEQHSSLVRHEKKLVKANEELKKLDVLKSEFLSNASHELRTPLTSIRMYNQLMLDEALGPINPEQKKSLQEIIDSTDHLISIINDLLDLKKLESGKMEYHLEELIVDDLVSNIHTALKALLQKKKTKLVVDAPKTLPTIIADKTRLIQVFTNLIGNAIKFNRNQAPIILKINLLTKHNNERLQFQVIDKGVGISKEEVKKLFDKFYQVDSTVTRAIEGSGLGLAITKEIVEAHKGEILVESIEGKGTTFTILLPLTQGT